MNRLCVQPTFGTLSASGGGSGGVKPRKHEQRLLRNMGVLNVVLDLLQIPYDQKEDVRMNELMKLAHEFLQYFCLGNAQNQVGAGKRSATLSTLFDNFFNLYGVRSTKGQSRLTNNGGCPI